MVKLVPSFVLITLSLLAGLNECHHDGVLINSCSGKHCKHGKDIIHVGGGKHGGILVHSHGKKHHKDTILIGGGGKGGGHGGHGQVLINSHNKHHKDTILVGGGGGGGHGGHYGADQSVQQSAPQQLQAVPQFMPMPYAFAYNPFTAAAAMPFSFGDSLGLASDHSFATVYAINPFLLNNALGFY